MSAVKDISVEWSQLTKNFTRRPKNHLTPSPSLSRKLN